MWKTGPLESILSADSAIWSSRGVKNLTRMLRGVVYFFYLNICCLLYSFSLIEKLLLLQSQTFLESSSCGLATLEDGGLGKKLRNKVRFVYKCSC